MLKSKISGMDVFGLTFVRIEEGKMLKKYLLVGVVIAITTVAHAITPRTTFMNGLSGGFNAGYQANKSKVAAYTVYNTPTAGIHIDYNRIVSNNAFMISGNTFLGSGLEVNYAFNSGNKIQPDVFNDSDIRTVKRRFTGVLTLRGGVVSGRTAYEVNGSLLVTKWSSQGNDITTKILSRLRAGFAPGTGVTFALDDSKRTSIGLAYRYEMYLKGSNAAFYPDSNSVNGISLAVPRHNAHVALVKFNMHF
ncbi:MAG: hypothetical protein WCG04_04460 [Alphaproteobacteria bacterium]